MRVASGELRPLTARSRRKRGSHEIDGALWLAQPRPRRFPDPPDGLEIADILIRARKSEKTETNA